MLSASLRKIARNAALLLLGAFAAAPAAAHPLEGDGRQLVATMGETVIALMADTGLDTAAREARFRAMYRAHFDHSDIAARAAGRAWTAASPAQRREYLTVLEDYIVKTYVALLSKFEGYRLLVLKSEEAHGVIVVTSLIVSPNPRASRDIEVIWRLHAVRGRLLVRDIAVDRISMILTERRAFAEWLREIGDTLDGLVAKLKEKIAALSRS